jgi:hypothetical protein
MVPEHFTVETFTYFVKKASHFICHGNLGMDITKLRHTLGLLIFFFFFYCSSTPVWSRSSRPSRKNLQEIQVNEWEPQRFTFENNNTFENLTWEEAVDRRK